MSFKENEGKLFFTVADTGIGISDADQRKLFRLFGKLSSSSKINTSGIGLGLHICKKIIETFGGKITLESTLGVGSRFTFSITTSLAQQGENPNLIESLSQEEEGKGNPQLATSPKEIHLTHASLDESHLKKASSPLEDVSEKNESPRQLSVMLEDAGVDVSSISDFASAPFMQLVNVAS